MLPKIALVLIQSLIFCMNVELTLAHPLSGRYVANVPSYEHQYVAAIIYITEENSATIYNLECSGVVIASDLVLTAAHCLEDKSIDNIKLVIGTNSISQNIHHNVSWWITYNEWMQIDDEDTNFVSNDVAIIKVVEQLPANVKPIKISRAAPIGLQNYEVTVFGWKESNNDPDVTQMKKAKIKILNNDVCRVRATNLNSNVQDFRERFFCTCVNPIVQLDGGDSGAPVLYRKKLIGLNVGTCEDEPGNNDKVNFHIGIHYFLDFIESFVSV